jgi:transcriptional regulator with XRE-family HTH domain
MSVDGLGGVAGSAGRLVRECRRAAGLTQAQVAALAGTSQSAVAAYEAGDREPTLPVLARLVRATGKVLQVQTVPDPALFRLADLADAIVDTMDESTKLRLVFEFLRGAADDGQPLRLLVAAEPRPTGDVRFDALLAAIAEDLCVHAGIAPPGWVHHDRRFLAVPWWVAELPSARARALVHAPASYRRRGVMIDPHDLEAA